MCMQVRRGPRTGHDPHSDLAGKRELESVIDG